jgi:hypothetical protein
MRNSEIGDNSVLHDFFFLPLRAPNFFLLRFGIRAQSDWTNAGIA